MLTGWNAKHTLAAIAMLLVFGLVLVFALNRGGDDDATEATPTPTPTETTTTAPTPSPQPADPLVVAPGRVGAALVGMTNAQAAATGLFDTNVDHGADDCRGVVPLEWKPSVSSALDVYTNDNHITTIGISSGPKTAKGIGVGSSLGALRSAYGDQLSPAVDAGFDQAGVYLAEDDQWLGFLFDTKRDAITDNSKITFMEVTRGEKPALIRDGC